MTVALHIRFPAGRYHGTSWGRHVNEAAVDWPPAPYRILRALYAQAFRRSSEAEHRELASLLGKLSRPPAYRLPAYSTGHTRHYLPTDRIPIESGRVLVFDGFVAVSPSDTMVIQWDVDLTAEEEGLLRSLIGAVTYLGRAESWCEACLGEPVEGAIGPGEGEGEPVSLLAVARDAEDVLQVLGARTDQLRKSDATVPAGTMWVRYFVPPPARPVRRRTRRARQSTAALFQLDAGARPRILDAVDVADGFRRALLSRCQGVATPTLIGRERGAPRESGHSHAHFIPFDIKRDGRITHLLLWAPEGFADEELEAMDTLRRVHRPRNAEELRVTFLEATNLNALERLPILGRSRHWASHTPFLLTRHPKRRGGRLVDGPEEQIRRELRHRGLPEPVEIERLPHCELNSRPLRWLEFRRWRGQREPAVPEPFGFRIELPHPISGPLTLGFGCHFGLGLFRPID